MKNKELTYWEFLKTNYYPHILAFLIMMLAIGFLSNEGDYDWGFWAWITIFTLAIIVVIWKGFIQHWKEYKNGKLS